MLDKGETYYLSSSDNISSNDSQNRDKAAKKRQNALSPNRLYQIAQNGANVDKIMPLAVEMIMDSQVKQEVSDRGDYYSATGNSWNQSEIDRAYQLYYAEERLFGMPKQSGGSDDEEERFSPEIFLNQLARFENKSAIKSYINTMSRPDTTKGVSKFASHVSQQNLTQHASEPVITPTVSQSVNGRKNFAIQEIDKSSSKSSKNLAYANSAAGDLNLSPFKRISPAITAISYMENDPSKVKQRLSKNSLIENADLSEDGIDLQSTQKLVCRSKSKINSSENRIQTNIDEASDSYDDQFSEQDKSETVVINQHKLTHLRQRRENTPQKLYQRFVEEALQGYKKGILMSDIKPIDLAAVMREFKDQWDFRFQDLYNKEPTEKYQCYVQNLGSTIQALLTHRMGRNFKIDLSKGKNLPNLHGKLAITVTTLHQGKFNESQLWGRGHGYGKNKRSPEDLLIQSLVDQASSKYTKMTTGDEATMAILIPEVPKKQAQPVDAQTALTLTCRRKQHVNEKGVPQKPKFSEPFLNEGAIFARDNELSISFLPKSPYPEQFFESKKVLAQNQRSPVLTKNNKQILIKDQSAFFQKQVERLIRKFDYHFENGEQKAYQELRETKSQMKEMHKTILGQQQFQGPSTFDPVTRRDQAMSEATKQESSFKQVNESVNDDTGTQLLEQLGKKAQKLSEEPRVLQTKADREKYLKNVNEMHKKYVQLESKVDSIVKCKWDSNQVLSQIQAEQDRQASMNKMAHHKLSRKNVKPINVPSIQTNPQPLSPQELFIAIEELKIKEQSVEARLPKISYSQKATDMLTRRFKESQVTSPKSSLEFEQIKLGALKKTSWRRNQIVSKSLHIQRNNQGAGKLQPLRNSQNLARVQALSLSQDSSFDKGLFSVGDKVKGGKSTIIADYPLEKNYRRPLQYQHIVSDSVLDSQWNALTKVEGKTDRSSNEKNIKRQDQLVKYSTFASEAKQLDSNNSMDLVNNSRLQANYQMQAASGDRFSQDSNVLAKENLISNFRSDSKILLNSDWTLSGTQTLIQRMELKRNVSRELVAMLRKKEVNKSVILQKQLPTPFDAEAANLMNQSASKFIRIDKGTQNKSSRRHLRKQVPSMNQATIRSNQRLNFVQVATTFRKIKERDLLFLGGNSNQLMTNRYENSGKTSRKKAFSSRLVITTADPVTLANLKDNPSATDHMIQTFTSQIGMLSPMQISNEQSYLARLNSTAEDSKKNQASKIIGNKETSSPAEITRNLKQVKYSQQLLGINQLRVQEQFLLPSVAK